MSIMVALPLALAPIVAASSEELAEDPLVVGVPADRCPVFYVDEQSGEVTGIGVDLMREAATRAGLAVTFRYIDETTLKDALDNDAYDLIMPLGSALDSTAGHETIVSDNLIQTPFTLVTKGARQTPSLNDLTVGMLRSLGAGAETVGELYPGIDIVFFDTMPEAVAALRAGSVDALLHNSFVWSYVLQKPSYADLMVQPSTMFSMDFRVGTRNTPQGRSVIDRLNEGIATLTDTQRQAIVLDYTTRRLYHYDLFDYLYQYGPLFILGTLLFASLIATILMRHRTYRLEQEERMRLLVDHDPLTGILSLNGFRKRVAELLRAHPDLPYLISYNNIKNFKFINDSLGMKKGDELLRFWATKTQDSLSDEEAVGRIDGDHFAVLRRMGGDEQIASDEELVVERVRNYFVDRGIEVRVQVCSGIYMLTPEDYLKVDVDHMLDFARVAERRVRETTKEGIEFYNQAQWEQGKRVADVVSHLPVAIQTKEIKVWYQPQMDYGTNTICGAEALCRWNHAKLGWLSPALFIQALEEAGLIHLLDQYVWETVCKDLRRWNAQGHHRSASVNLSRSDIRDDLDIPRHFHDLVRRYDLSFDQLRIEITETAFAENPTRLIDTMQRLQELGFQVEMDDFGSGYSSLHMLKEVPVDRIKLDLHFLTSSGDQEKGRVIVDYIIQMVQALGMSLITEGVENASQAEFLKSRGCAEMQGYYFYKPMPVEEFEQVCDEDRTPSSGPAS